MANVLLTQQKICDIGLMGLSTKLNLPKKLTRRLVQEFGQPAEYKPGDTVKFRKPYRFVPTSGLAWQPQPLVDMVATAQVNRVAGIHLSAGMIERTLDMREAWDIIADPVGDALGAQITAEAATFCADNCLNSVGTPGVTPTAVSTYLAAGDRLVEQGMNGNAKPNLFINRNMSSAFVTAQQTFFNPVGSISKGIQDGEMQNSFGYDVNAEQLINTHVNGNFAGTPLVNGANQTAEQGNNNTMSLVLDGFNAGATVNKGDRFTIGSASSATVGGVNTVHPQARTSNRNQQVFTIQAAATADGSGNLTVTVAPAITPSGQYQNVTGAAVDNAIVSFIGAANAEAQQGLLLAKNAFGFIPVPFKGPENGTGVRVTKSVDPDTGLAITLTVWTDGETMDTNMRFDTLYDFVKLYGEMGTVIQG